jgi:sec-independent protein translocase protein TatA
VIGLPEILVLAVIVLVVFGYKKLPQLGRSAGEGLRTGVDKAKELGSSVGDKAEGKVDPQAIGRQAGQGLREAREFRDALTGKAPAKPAAAPAASPPAPAADARADEASDKPTSSS